MDESGPNSGPLAAQIPALHMVAAIGNAMKPEYKTLDNKEYLHSVAESCNSTHIKLLGAAGFEPA